MNNLSLILKSYFVDANFDSIVNADLGQSPEKGMDDNTFANLFLKNEIAYGFDVVNAINRYIGNCGVIDEFGRRSVFNILTFAIKDILLLKNDNPVCRQEHFLRWNEISRIVGEDLLVVAYLAKTFSKGYDISSFAWKPFIRSDSIAINDILNRGLYELHSHLNAASLNFDVNWLALMNAAKMKEKMKEQLYKLFPVEMMAAHKAIAIRFYLFSKINGITPNFPVSGILKCDNWLNLNQLLGDCGKEIVLQMQKAFLFDGESIDYAIPRAISQKDRKRYYNVPLIGERKFLYDCMQKVFSSSEGRNEYARLLYAYIVAKNQFRQVIVQCDKIKGFGYFAGIQKRKYLFDNEKYRELLLFMAVQNIVCNQPIKAMEMRIAPNNTKNGLMKEIDFCNQCINKKSFLLGQKNLLDENVKLGYVLHFIKQKEKQEIETNGDYYCRNFTVRKNVKKQASIIEDLIKRNSPLVMGNGEPFKRKENFINGSTEVCSSYPIVGIDAASSEFYCRPEVFAPAFRRLKYVQRNTDQDFYVYRTDRQLGRTFHVGEDFYDIVDGLRAIDECVCFMNFGEGDRIGHGIALGVNAKNYYEQRQYRIILPKHDLLDNVVWMYKMMEFYSIHDENGLMAKLEKIFRERYHEIYKEFIDNNEEMANISLSDYYDSWKLRGDDPEILWDDSNFKEYEEGSHKELKSIRSVKKYLSLFHAYHYSGSAKRKGAECEELRLPEGYCNAVAILQKKIRERIQNKHISVETNPTSNMQITDVGRYAEHPITVMNNVFLKPNYDSMIDVSINTDDQGVFATSLEKEFTLMALALEKEKKEDGSPLYRRDDIYQWLDKVRDSARSRSFLYN